MPRTHPPTLLAIASRTIRAERLFGTGDRVLVAVSGGPDSMALLHVLARLRAKLGYGLVAHGVDHGLREAAAAELDGAESFARSLDVAFARTRLAVAPGGNLQARARAARYEALRAVASREGVAAIATAHHREDRAETVLLRLLRGAGPRGLAVLPPRTGDLVRPLIEAPRAAIEAHIARHAVPFALDPSNRDPRFLRSRVRHELLPLLRALSPGIDDHLCALAEQLARAPLPAPPIDVLGGAPIARAARRAIDALLANGSPRARVALKQGLVVRWDGSRRSLTVEPGSARGDENQNEKKNVMKGSAKRGGCGAAGVPRSRPEATK